MNTDIKAIKRFFNRAVELDYLSRSPASKIKLLRTTNKKARFFTESEAVRILSRTEGRVRSVYLTLLLTGMRIGELINLEWEDVDFEGRKIVVRPKEFWSPKGMEERAIPLHRALAHLLIDMPRVSRWVFTKPDGEQLNVHSLETRLRRLLRKLEIENASLHTWRHTFASYLMMRSGNIRAIQKLPGHKSIGTTEIYAHLSDKHLYHVVSMLPDPVSGTVEDFPL